MALSSMMRRASSPMLPLAIRAVGSPRSFHGAIATAVNVHQRTIFSPKSRFQSQSCYSSAANPTVAKKAVDDSLIRIINSEIKSVNPVHEIPKSFPFTIEVTIEDTIEDNSAEGTLVLTREDGDEKIKVEVDITALENSVRVEDCDSSDSESDDTANDSDDDSCEETNTDKNNDNSKNKTSDTDDSCDDSDSDDSHNDSDDNGEDNKKEKRRSSFPMTVSVIKANGLALEFEVMASADNVTIQTLMIKESTESVDEYEGPHFWDLDPELKDAMHRYLEIRGVKPIMVENLQKYKMNQNRKEELQWLKKLKKFIKK